MGRVAVVGDVGGHRDALAAALRGLGAVDDDAVLRLPADLVVVQVGDLVHRGPDSPGVLRLVDGIMARQPDQWVQLVGNHEQRYVHRAVFRWPETLDEGSVATLLRWWRTGRMRAAAAFTDGAGLGWLACHGGLTAEYARDVLGRPGTAHEAAEAINALHDDERLWRAGAKLTGVPDRWAGPVWTDAARELHPSWLARYAERAAPPPYAQVHGHSQAARWDADVPGLVIDRRARHQTRTVGGVPLVGVDPQHGRHGAPEWSPLVFTDATVVRRPAGPPSPGP